MNEEEKYISRTQLNELKDLLYKGKQLKGIQIDPQPQTVKENYYLSPFVENPHHLSWEMVNMNHSTAQTGSFVRPIFYVEGNQIIENKFYTDGKNIWECVQTGTPDHYVFDNTEWFDVINI